MTSHFGLWLRLAPKIDVFLPALSTWVILEIVDALKVDRAVAARVYELQSCRTANFLNE